MEDFIAFKHKVTGKVQMLPEHWIENPHFADQFELTDEDVECSTCVIPLPSEPPVDEADYTYEIEDYEDE